jgi:hypothetical protein
MVDLPGSLMENFPSLTAASTAGMSKGMSWNDEQERASRATSKLPNYRRDVLGSDHLTRPCRLAHIL